MERRCWLLRTNGGERKFKEAIAIEKDPRKIK
jgi:hypothetical protein